ncbi:HNH endonuclease [Streptomyces sp. NPDC045470]|uniref:HNH endonuclease n=1 Tax=Streptomyces sp. NPDC045470 TaxID=3155469 RepID=UPI00340D08F0
MATAWLVLAAGDNRKHGGNGGYDDLPSEHYSWDSSVPHHASLAAGDVIAVWDKTALLGISVIERIEAGQAIKEIYRCPECGKADFQPRKTKRPVYVCLKCPAKFDTPAAGAKAVTTYRSRHGASWVDMPGILSGAELRALCDNPRTQHSLRSMRWEGLRNAIAATGTATSVDIADNAQRAIAGGHRQTTVRVRLGQAAFRRQLVTAHGETCAVTGPAPAAVLEAAHLYSYASSGEHHSDGGLLLRRDIHRLFDLGLLAVDPAALTVDVAPRLRDYPVYAILQDAPLAVAVTSRHRQWLRAHWEIHRRTAPASLGDAKRGGSGSGW